MCSLDINGVAERAASASMRCLKPSGGFFLQSHLFKGQVEVVKSKGGRGKGEDYEADKALDFVAGDFCFGSLAHFSCGRFSGSEGNQLPGVPE